MSIRRRKKDCKPQCHCLHRNRHQNRDLNPDANIEREQDREPSCPKRSWIETCSKHKSRLCIIAAFVACFCMRARQAHGICQLLPDVRWNKSRCQVVLQKEVEHLVNSWMYRGHASTAMSLQQSRTSVQLLARHTKWSRSRR